MGRKHNVKRLNRVNGTSFRRVLDIAGLSGDLSDNLGESTLLSEKVEYGYFELNTQATKPFVAAYFIKAFLDYDTDVSSGDLIKINDGRRLLVTVKNPDIYRNEVIRNMAICYKTNATIKIERKTGSQIDEKTRNKVWTYDEITPRAHCLLTEGDFRSELLEEGFGKVEVTKRELYLQGSLKIQLADRVIAVGEDRPLYVRQVKRSYFDGIDFCMLDYER